MIILHKNKSLQLVFVREEILNSMILGKLKKTYNIKIVKNLVI